jgi:hypothetical protein
MQYFRDRFPETKFEFIGAGISSMGSVPHAFRLERDVLSKGPVDLLFVEAAVNDTSNTSEVVHMLRGMEGVVRHARSVNPLTDIVHMHFVMPAHMMDYKNGKIPDSIAQHEKVASAYGNPTLNLSLEVTDRIQAVNSLGMMISKTCIHHLLAIGFMPTVLLECVRPLLLGLIWRYKTTCNASPGRYEKLRTRAFGGDIQRSSVKWIRNRKRLETR